MALPAELILALEELPAADQAIVGALLSVIGNLSATTDALAEGLGALNALDDRRARQIADLELTVRLLADAAGIETKGSPLAELIAQYTTPKPESLDAHRVRCTRCGLGSSERPIFPSPAGPFHVACYQHEVRELHDRRRAGGGDNG